MIKGFTAADVPSQTGRTFLVTGANTGLGFEVAQVLAGRGGRVLLGCRTRSKAEDAVARIRAAHPDADLGIIDLDQGSLASVRAAAERVAAEPRLDVLVNNAGIMMPPLERTADGFESQLGVNHLGTFALTGLLLPKLAQTPGSRIVNTSSNAHKFGKIEFDDVNAERSYSQRVRDHRRGGASRRLGHRSLPPVSNPDPPASSRRAPRAEHQRPGRMAHPARRDPSRCPGRAILRPAGRDAACRTGSTGAAQRPEPGSGPGEAPVGSLD
jgi:hypothetical protein